MGSWKMWYTVCGTHFNHDDQWKVTQKRLYSTLSRQICSFIDYLDTTPESVGEARVSSF